MFNSPPWWGASPGGMQAGYRYIGPWDLARVLPEAPERVRVACAGDIRRWVASQQGTSARSASQIVTTFIVDTEGQLWVADRHSEHVQCARGQDVLSAGEMTF